MAVAEVGIERVLGGGGLTLRPIAELYVITRVSEASRQYEYGQDRRTARERGGPPPPR